MEKSGEMKTEKEVTTASKVPLLNSLGFGSSKTTQGTTITAEGATHPTQPNLKPTEELAFVSSNNRRRMRAMALTSGKKQIKPPRPPTSSGKGGSTNSSSF